MTSRPARPRGRARDRAERPGNLAIHDEEWGRAAELYQQSLDLFARSGNTLGMARAMLNLSDVRLRFRDRCDARTLLEQSLEMFERRGMWWDIVYVIENLGGVAAYDAAWRTRPG